ncbi:alpha-E domain-containing protein [Chloroflexus sp.]|uniref:alpha-E domain-containing protein n=1 Tax=Chloroflexus sp. TaxID=1904827 RepID=UPI002ACE3651|nr:alpha-E domain-containing protein [Chloroflexus sp.]
MLSRVADNLYWMSRYLERTEHTARLIGVGLTQILDQTPQAIAPRWGRLLAALHVEPPETGLDDPQAITRLLTTDAANPASLVSCITLARENARQVREQISSEMWEHINQLYLRMRTTTIEQIWHDEPVEFYQMVKERLHLIQGITDATMNHGEGWRFIQVGRYLERIWATTLLLEVFFQPYLNGDEGAIDSIDWVVLLKSCTAFEAYCKVYTADVQPAQIAEFLLLNAESPRSIRFAADQLQDSLEQISQRAGSRHAGRAERLAGRLRAQLDYGQVDEIIADDLPLFLQQIRQQCTAIHEAIYQAYITYPIEQALLR